MSCALFTIIGHVTKMHKIVLTNADKRLNDGNSKNETDANALEKRVRGIAYIKNCFLVKRPLYKEVMNDVGLI